ncbi:MAG: alpha-amylase family glycosyl hydrolase [Acidobacteriota bacterium]|nr:alpha-amylase family glycosyl hydrolase [Acidobacteriota bacterium]
MMKSKSGRTGAEAWGLAAVVLATMAFASACASGAGIQPPAAATATAPGEAAPGAPAQTAALTVEPHSQWAEAILYFVILDRFADGDESNNRAVDREAQGAFHGGDLAGLRQQLDELAELGVTALWITPVVKNIDHFVTGAGFPDWGYHGYWADDFYSLDSRFGTEEELKALVEDAHQRGMAVLLDVVYNHAGYDSQYLKNPRTRTWLRSEQYGGCGADDLTGCLAGLPDFRTEDPQVRDYLMEAHLGLAERVGLDGFRLDTVKHVSHDFWQEHRRRVRERLGDDFFLLGEVWGGDARSLDPWFEGDEMDAGFDFGFQGSTLGFLQGRGRPVAYNRYLEKRHEVRDGHHLAHYLGSHDVPMSLYQLEGDLERFRLAALLQLTTAGIPTIYYGEEVARLGGDWPANRSDMPWGDRAIEPGAGDPRDEDLRDFYRRLIEIRRQHPALWRGTHEGLDFGTDHLVFLRRAAGEDGELADAVVVAVNRSEEPVDIRFASPWPGGSPVRDLLSGQAPTAATDAAGSPELTLTLPALGGVVLAPDTSDTGSTDTVSSMAGASDTGSAPPPETHKE